MATLDNPYLTNDLVDELQSQGHKVTVVAYGDLSIVKKTEHLEEHIIGVSSSIKILKYVLLWPKLFYHLIIVFRNNKPFDQIVVQAPLTVKLPAAFFIKLASSRKKTLMVFDIFPLHHTKIKSLPPWSEKILKTVEMFLMKGFTEITAMGKGNRQFIQDYYFGGDATVPIKIMHLWGKTNVNIQPANYVDGPIKIVFGGQIVKGRNSAALIEFLNILRKRNFDLTLTFYSWGEEYERIKRRYADYEWISFQRQVSRKDYQSLLSHFHVGAIVTDKNADVPTFPSKTIDYISSGLYCFCLVEKESELYNVVGDFQRIYINSFDFSEVGIQSAINFLNSIKNIDTDYEVSELIDIFSVKNAVAKLLE